jgi:hypothetical protein
MDAHAAWEQALKKTTIVRTRIMGLQTFSETQVPYILLSPSSINIGDTVVRQGKVVVHKPSLILPPHVPQFEGFDFEKPEDPVDEDMMINFLLVRGITLPSLKYDNKTHSLDIFEGSVDAAISFYGNKLQREENTSTGLMTGPEDLWQFSLLIFICAQVARNSSSDIRRLLDEYHRKSLD